MPLESAYHMTGARHMAGRRWTERFSLAPCRLGYGDVLRLHGGTNPSPADTELVLIGTADGESTFLREFGAG
jgi:hypothetical protein